MNKSEPLKIRQHIAYSSALFLSVLLALSTFLFASAQGGAHSGRIKTKTSSKKKRGLYSGWEIYQSSKSMGTNRMLLCAGGMKIVNPLMSLVYWPASSQLVMINNSNHKYFPCVKEKFPHYVKLMGFDLFSSGSKGIKYSEWKKIETGKVVGMESALYERTAINLPPNSERKEQTWVSSEIDLPQSLYSVYSEVSGRVDSCHFGFPLSSKVISNMPPEGFKVHVDFDTKEMTEKQFTAGDFQPPKDYVLVKEFSEFLLNDSEAKSNKFSEKGSNNNSEKDSDEKLKSALSEFKSKASAEKAKERIKQRAEAGK